MKPEVWLITAKTNLHVGNENVTSYGLIDKAVQRDALTGLPCINSSSLKGALNEWSSKCIQMGENERIEIFGVDKLNNKSETRKGSYTFFDANILFLPVQDDETLYKRVSCPSVIKIFKEKLNLFGIESKYIENELYKKGFDFTYTSEKTQHNDKMQNELFSELCNDYNLPIIARNKIENGESKNLWYEQILPSETVFYTLITGSEQRILEKELEHQKDPEKQLVQIGANATIGYGYCKFTKLI